MPQWAYISSPHLSRADLALFCPHRHPLQGPPLQEAAEKSSLAVPGIYFLQRPTILCSSVGCMLNIWRFFGLLWLLQRAPVPLSLIQQHQQVQQQKHQLQRPQHWLIVWAVSPSGQVLTCLQSTSHLPGRAGPNDSLRKRHLSPRLFHAAISESVGRKQWSIGTTETDMEILKLGITAQLQICSHIWMKSRHIHSHPGI